MVLALTCALCLAVPDAPSGPAPLTLLGSELTLGQPPATPSRAPVPLAVGRLPDGGSGDGDTSSHSDHMGPMWILMGAMMVVMMVGMGVFLMRHETAGPVHSGGAGLSPAQLALPVGVGRTAGG